MLLRRVLSALTIAGLIGCQDSGSVDPMGPGAEPPPHLAVLPAPLKVAVPVTLAQNLGGLMYPGPVGIAVAPLTSMESYRLLKPLGEAAEYASVAFLPGGREALAAATVPSFDPPYPGYVLGWAYLLKFDLESGELTGKVLLEGVPGTVWEEGGDAWRMDVTQDGKLAYVSLFYSEAIAVVDLRSMTFVGYIKLPTPPGSGRFIPQDPELIDADRALLVNDQITGQVLRIDTQSLEIQQLYDPGAGGSTSITLSADGRILLESSTEFLNVVDLKSGNAVAQIPCLLPTAHQFLPGDRRVVVACRDEDRLIVVDRKDWSVLWEMEIVGGPHRLNIDNSGRRAVFSTWNTNELVLVDLIQRRVVARVAMPNRLWGPMIWPGRYVD